MVDFNAGSPAEQAEMILAAKVQRRAARGLSSDPLSALP